ncbi:MAG TPA: hypothetical protein VGP37_05730 [Candidatus Nanopelagicales bacterium]|nr:hypothetical protein [Candidatus Nanopelagicales bacterium]
MTSPQVERSERPERPERPELSVVIAGVVVGLLSGAALGVLWWRLAPRVPVVIQPDGSRPEGFQPEEYLAADIAFAALALVAGLILTVALAAMRRQHLLGVLLAGLVAGTLGTFAMWQVGTRLGSVDIEGLIATTDVEFVVDAPLEVTMPGVFLVWAIASAVVVAVLALADWLASFRLDRQRSAQGELG